VGTARFTLGLLLLRAEEFDRASADLHAAQELLGDSERMQIAMGSVLLRRAAIPTNANDPLARDAGKIESMLLDSRYDEAFPAFRALLTRYPKTPYLHYAFGTALMALSEFDDAAAQMKAEQVNSPDSALPYEGLASIALRQHRPSDAVENARLAIARSSNAAEPHYLLGRALLESAVDIPGAVKELQQAAQLDPNSPEVHYSLAKAYARESDSTKAEQERAIFTRLNELSEQQGSGQTPQSYAGPRESNILSGAASSQNSPR
jgi:predicted Zn-dependent protease